MQRSDEQRIKVCAEPGSNVPVVVGDCPKCGSGKRSLVLTNFAMNGRNPQASMVYFKCLACMSVIEKKIIDVAEDD
jgi:hypothetical protein